MQLVPEYTTVLICVTFRVVSSQTGIGGNILVVRLVATVENIWTYLDGITVGQDW